MKQLHWTKLNDKQLKTTLWSKVDYKKIELEPAQVEELFSARKKKKREDEEGGEGGEDGDSGPQRKGQQRAGATRVELIDSKRARNVEILLRSVFKMEDRHIRTAIVELDTSVLSSDRLQQLISILPTSDEVSL